MECIYEITDRTINNMSESELANYLVNNYPKYAEQLVDCIVSELIIADKDHKFQTYIDLED